jgi:hydroxylamine dehydrogenase
MKSFFRFSLLLFTMTLIIVGCSKNEEMGDLPGQNDDAVMVSYEPNMEDPCIACHVSATPGIVATYAKSEHNPNKVSCQACHVAQDGDPTAQGHNGFTITKVPSPNYCATCHPQEVAQNANSKHAWTAFIGQYKPYYAEARKRGLDPLAQETAKLLDPEKMAKTVVSPLVPDSGILKKIGLLDDPEYNHNNVTLGCSACHGTFIIVEDDGSISGLPNVGVGRVNADGSLGSCSSCHTRHLFSKEEARKPETCGQCHLGPDHPQHEIYMESKHGNIYGAVGETWNWDADDWGPDDIDAPTCSTCHMSQFGPVQATHDVGDRLYWELQPKTSVPQWKGPDELDFVLERVPDPEQAAKGRKEMLAVCTQCHSTAWAEGHFTEFDMVVEDYNKVWAYTDNLLKEAYAKGIVSKDNPLDETSEIYHYLIWHHSGRRWRMGASMMGPDYTHWNGAVDTNMRYLGLMINDLELREMIKNK